MYDINVSNPKKTLENILLRQKYNGMLLFFYFQGLFFFFSFRKLFKKYLLYFILILHKSSFKNKGSYDYILELSSGSHFSGTPIRKTRGHRGISTVLEWPPKFFWESFRPSIRKTKNGLYYRTLLQSLAYYAQLTNNNLSEEAMSGTIQWSGRKRFFN